MPQVRNSTDGLQQPLLGRPPSLSHHPFDQDVGNRRWFGQGGWIGLPHQAKPVWGNVNSASNVSAGKTDTILAGMAANDQPANGSARAGLYIHVPFCASVCPYCDFAVTMAGEERRAGWERALIAEAKGAAERGWNFDTVYFGGGTPSNLDSVRLERVVAALCEGLNIVPEARWTLEVNPEDVSEAAVGHWERLGFDGVSVGVQSLDDRDLRFLGRRHSADRARAALEVLRRGAFRTISADLIFGLPGRRIDRWQRQLEEVLELGIDHLSCYQLTVHRGTVFGKRRQSGTLAVMGEAGQAKFYELTHEILGRAGFEPYEVSNYARPGHRSHHNLKYWTGAPYLGLGPGAHSFDGDRTRWWNERKLRMWWKNLDEGLSPVEGEEHLTAAQRALESVMLGFRLADGVDLAGVERRWGVSVIDSNQIALARLEEQDLIRRDGCRVAPTPAGMAVADALAREIEIVDR